MESSLLYVIVAVMLVVSLVWSAYIIGHEVGSRQAQKAETKEMQKLTKLIRAL